jgi:hypothetical protein
MNLGSSVVDAIFSRHGVPGPWEPLPSLGLANRIFATHDVVLRVATDHLDGVADARTESVAAPVARAAGILTPRLIAFDDARTLVDRPFSLWERVHGDTLGLATLTRGQRADVWRSVGSELAKLHLRVRECADPHGFLDQPARDQHVGGILKRLLGAGRVDRDTARRIELMAEELWPRVTEVLETRFIHGDIHAMNVMCSSKGELLAIIDWGDPAATSSGHPIHPVTRFIQSRGEQERRLAMIRRALWLLGTMVGGEMLARTDWGLVRVSCRRCGHRGPPRATIQTLRLTSRWGWLQTMRHLLDGYFFFRVRGSDVFQAPNSSIDGRILHDEYWEGTSARWGQMEVPTCPKCGHFPMCSPRAFRSQPAGAGSENPPAAESGESTAGGPREQTTARSLPPLPPLPPRS